MAANLSTHLPIIPVQTVSGNQEEIFNYVEGATQTFNNGTPVVISSGAVVASTSPLSGGTNLLAGIAAYPGHNLASAGKGASPLYGSIGFPGGAPTFGSVPNQASAVNLLHGSPFVDGLMPTYLAVEDTIFEVQVDNSTGSNFTASTADLGKYATLVTDANNWWYLDRNTISTTVGTLSVVILSLNPQDLVAGSTTTQVANGRARVRFLPLVSQLVYG
jgi:hypothetical protein